MTSPPAHATDPRETSLAVAPARPDEPGVPFPPVAEDAYDAELESIAGERDRFAARALAAVRFATVVVAAMLAGSLRHDLRWAFASGDPVRLTATATAEQLDGAAHRLVEIPGIPGGVGAVDYRRPLREGQFRLAPLVDRADVFVELRLPDGADPTRFVPPTSLRGRLVPLDEGGVRFANARNLVERATGRALPERAWLIEQGAQPSVSPAAVVALLAIVVMLVQTGLLLSGRGRRPGAAA